MTRSAFARGIVCVIAVFIALAGIIHLANNGHHRPEGYAEDWLSSVADTTRKGVHDESVRRADKVGPVAVAEPLLKQAGSTGGKRAFADLEVGKASAPDATGVVRVPYRLHVYRKTGTEPVVDGVVLLKRGPAASSGSASSGSWWRVVGLGDRAAGEKVPSEGGAPPSSAPGLLWVVALAAGAGLTALASLAVRLATPQPA